MDEIYGVNRRLRIKTVLKYFTLAMFLISGATMAIRLEFMHILASDSTLGITPPSYMDAGNLLSLWMVWAVTSILVIIGFILYLGNMQ